jgi:hydrogenase expression/formation protein HypC
MCVGVPGRVVAVDGPFATVDFAGRQRIVRVDLLEDPVHEGEYVLVHLGYAVRPIPAEDVREWLAMIGVETPG